MADTRWWGDRGTGLLALAGGFLVFVLFLLLATQLLVGLYARSVVTAVASDAAHRAATDGADSIDDIERDARAALGRAGRGASFTWSFDDLDGDHEADRVSLTVRVDRPAVLPGSLSSRRGDRIIRTVRVRMEAA